MDTFRCIATGNRDSVDSRKLCKAVNVLCRQVFQNKVLVLRTGSSFDRNKTLVGTISVKCTVLNRHIMRIAQSSKSAARQYVNECIRSGSHRRAFILEVAIRDGKRIIIIEATAVKQELPHHRMVSTVDGDVQILFLLNRGILGNVFKQGDRHVAGLFMRRIDRRLEGGVILRLRSVEHGRHINRVDQFTLKIDVKFGLYCCFTIVDLPQTVCADHQRIARAVLGERALQGAAGDLDVEVQRLRAAGFLHVDRRLVGRTAVDKLTVFDRKVDRLSAFVINVQELAGTVKRTAVINDRHVPAVDPHIVVTVRLVERTILVGLVAVCRKSAVESAALKRQSAVVLEAMIVVISEVERNVFDRRTVRDRSNAAAARMIEYHVVDFAFKRDLLGKVRKRICARFQHFDRIARLRCRNRIRKGQVADAADLGNVDRNIKIAVMPSVSALSVRTEVDRIKAGLICANDIVGRDRIPDDVVAFDLCRFKFIVFRKIERKHVFRGIIRVLHETICRHIIGLAPAVHAAEQVVFSFDNIVTGLTNGDVDALGAVLRLVDRIRDRFQVDRFVRRLVRRFVRRLVRGFVRRFVRRFVRGLVHGFVRRFVRRLVRGLVRGFVRRFIRGFVRRVDRVRDRVCRPLGIRFGIRGQNDDRSVVVARFHGIIREHRRRCEREDHHDAQNHCDQTSCHLFPLRTEYFIARYTPCVYILYYRMVFG